MKRALAFIIIGLFAFFGLFMASNILHESVHKFDYRNVATDDELCILTASDGIKDMFTSNIAYYKFEYDIEDIDTVKDITSKTEYKAYLADAVLIFLFINCLYIIGRKEK